MRPANTAGTELLDDRPPAPFSVLRFTVGLDVEGGLRNAGGDLPDVRLFNEAGEFLGISADPGEIGDGSTAEIRVKHDKNNGQQAAYALFSANDNAICITSLSITWPNGDQYGWVGNWGRACGAPWYFSNVFLQGSDFKPDCMWIDGNGDQPTTGFQVHWPEFTNKGEDASEALKGKSRDYFCNAGPPFKLYTNPDPRSITYWLPRNSDRRRQRAIAVSEEAPPRKTDIHDRRRRRRRLRHVQGENAILNSNGTTGASLVTPPYRFADLLVLDASSEHSAAVLCGSATSAGPDFANGAERLFCRMSDKTLWPFCDATRRITDNCFDTGLQQLVIGAKAARDKGYGRVISWGGDDNGDEGDR
ncbi:hypothetical protein VTK26DRAFT_9301 [Humicola hyalothermophila]